MSIQWTFIAGYLYVEIGIVIALMLPIASPRIWRQFFRSRLFFAFKNHTAIYFCVLLGILCLFMFDSIREMRKYSSSTDAGHANLQSEMKGTVKLFRAQRNFYITGFAIFLSFVIRRLVTMILIQADMMDKTESLIKLHDGAKRAVDDYDICKTKLEICLGMLDKEKERVEQLEEELQDWKTKNIQPLTAIKGKGDE